MIPTIPGIIIALIAWRKYTLSHRGLLKVELSLRPWISGIEPKAELKFALVVRNFGRTTITPEYLVVQPYKRKPYKSRKDPLLLTFPELDRPLEPDGEPIRIDVHSTFATEMFARTLKFRSIDVQDTLGRKWRVSRAGMRRLRRQLKNQVIEPKPSPEKYSD